MASCSCTPLGSRVGPRNAQACPVPRHALATAARRQRAQPAQVAYTSADISTALPAAGRPSPLSQQPVHILAGSHLDTTTTTTTTSSSSSSSSPDVQSRCVGAMLGAMCGNVLGAPVEHDRHWMVTRRFPQGLTDFWRWDTSQHPTSYGHYTGDFALLLATARGLVSAGGAATPALAYSLLEADLVEEGQETAATTPQQQQQRGQGRQDSQQGGEEEGRRQRRLSQYTRVLLSALATSRVPLSSLPHLALKYLNEHTSRNSHISGDRFEREPYGPEDSGAAARILPLALAYRDAPAEVLEEAVQRACMFSHNQPVGLDGARVMAAAVAWLARHDSRGSGVISGPRQLLEHLMGVAQTQDMRDKLQLLIDNSFQLGRVTSWSALYRGAQWARLTELLTRLTYHGYATAGTEAVAVALLALTTSWEQPEQAVVVAASFGGSTPVTSQLTGALAGALHGDAWLPARWTQALENGPRGGRDSVAALARDLAALRWGGEDPASRN